MAENTKIEWAHHTFNPWIGCTRVGPGCDHCYAADLSKARLGVEWGPGAPRRRTAPSTWSQPRRWNNRAAKLGIRYRVFCASLADVFDNEIDPAWRADLFALIRDTPHLDWLLVTKRIGNAAKMAEEAGGWPGNVWLGATIVNQAEADRDIPKLLAIEGPRFRFLSMEPLLGPVDLRSVKAPRHPDEPDDELDIDWRFDALETGDYYWFDGEDGQPGDSSDGPYREHRIDWVIAGGESGAEARPVHPDWVRALRDQCASATLGWDDAPVAFLFKQWGEFAPCITDDIGDRIACFEDGAATPVFEMEDRRYPVVQAHGREFRRVGKRNAGRLLDGAQHDAVPL